jgi:hypothetical protein
MRPAFADQGPNVFRRDWGRVPACLIGFLGDID